LVISHNCYCAQISGLGYQNGHLVVLYIVQ